jgi:hypothetical protein
MFRHCTDTSVHVHTHTSFPIKPDQPCDAGSESQLHAGAAPSELPSWHQSFQLTDHIWNPTHLDRIWQNCTYVSEPCTYMSVHVHTSSWIHEHVCT